MKWFTETLYSGPSGEGYAQRFEIAKVVRRLRTDVQDLIIFESPHYGRVLALDGIIQTTERDEFAYHEMMVHVPLVAHGSPKEVLIIGGGDGGCLREALRHPVDRVTMVEIDRTVVDLCAEHMPSLSDGAFDDPRTDLIITDGLKYVAETDRRFDVIIVDSTDPIGPGEVLFTEKFYGDCRKCLTPGGIVVTQNGVPSFQPREVTRSHRRLGTHFADVSFFLTVVPTYIGGFMALGWATDDKALRQQTAADLTPRFETLGMTTRYYNPAVHAGSFALPPFIGELMA